MLSRILVLSLSLISFSCFANCPQAPATTSPDFCSGFKTSAYCHCVDKGMDGSVCDDMGQVYDAMIDYFKNSPEGALGGACSYGQEEEDGVPKQVCMDDWNCYRNGGTNSQGGLCSSTGSICPQ